MRSVVSVRPFVLTFVRLFPLCPLNQLALTQIRCMCMSDDHSSPMIESQGHWSRSKVNEKLCVPQKYPLRVLWVVIDGGSIGFRCNVISCDLARRGMRHDAAEAVAAAELNAC